MGCIDAAIPERIVPNSPDSECWQLAGLSARLPGAEAHSQWMHMRFDLSLCARFWGKSRRRQLLQPLVLWIGVPPAQGGRLFCV